jgi:hypothetical protein
LFTLQTIWPALAAGATVNPPSDARDTSAQNTPRLADRPRGSTLARNPGTMLRA